MCELQRHGLFHPCRCIIQDRLRNCKHYFARKARFLHGFLRQTSEERSIGLRSESVFPITTAQSRNGARLDKGRSADSALHRTERSFDLRDKAISGRTKGSSGGSLCRFIFRPPASPSAAAAALPTLPSFCGCGAWCGKQMFHVEQFAYAVYAHNVGRNLQALRRGIGKLKMENVKWKNSFFTIHYSFVPGGGSRGAQCAPLQGGKRGTAGAR